MNRPFCVILVVLAAATLLYAGGAPAPEGGPPGGARGRGQPGGPDFAFAGAMRGGDTIYVPRSGVLTTARRYFLLSDEEREALSDFEAAREKEARMVIVVLYEELDKKYATLAAEALLPDDKAKYEKVVAAEAERDAQIRTAQDEFRIVLDRASAVFGGRPTLRLPTNADQIISYCVKLSEDQTKDISELRAAGQTEWANLIGGLERPQDWRDEKARQAWMEKNTQIRRQVESEVGDAMLMVLTEPQRKAVQAAVDAMETCDRNVQQATEACEKNLTELVGKAKLEAEPTDTGVHPFWR
jgi:hypothetical protein